MTIRRLTRTCAASVAYHVAFLDLKSQWGSGFSTKTMMKVARKKEWFDDDSFWRETYPFMFPAERLAKAPEQVAKILALTRPPGKSALDLCSGPGRCSIALAKRGYSVTGVDRTKYLLDKAKGRARAARVKIEWVRSDMRDFVRPDSFALVLSMFTSFGYFENKHEDMIVLKNMFTSLRPGGVCLIDAMGKERLAKVFQSPVSNRLPDGSMLVDHHEVYDDWTRIRNEWSVIRKGRVKTFKFNLTIYSGLELRERMESAGFVGVTLYGNLDGIKYDSNAERLIAIGRKPHSRRNAVRAGRPKS